MLSIKDTTTTSTALPIDYEVACDIMGTVIAYYTKKINDEESKVEPDKARLDALNKKFVEVFRAQRDLRASEPEKIKALCDHYAPMARTVLSGGEL